MEDIIIIGSSGHAKVVIDIVQQEGKYHIIGLIDRFRKVDEETIGYKILGKEEDLPKLIKMHTIKGILVAIGDNSIRAKVVSSVRETCPNICFVSAIHPHASIATNVSIGEGTVVMAGVSINPCVSIGEFCILNTNSSLDHDSKMANFSSLAPRVVTGGYCDIGEYSAICIGATLIERVHIGKHTVIGAASLVLKSLGAYTIAYGNPVKKIRARKQGDKYI